MKVYQLFSVIVQFNQDNSTISSSLVLNDELIFHRICTVSNTIIVNKHLWIKNLNLFKELDIS